MADAEVMSDRKSKLAPCIGYSAVRRFCSPAAHPRLGSQTRPSSRQSRCTRALPSAEANSRWIWIITSAETSIEANGRPQSFWAGQLGRIAQGRPPG
jgi:hypothetical protein